MAARLRLSYEPGKRPCRLTYQISHIAAHLFPCNFIGPDAPPCTSSEGMLGTVLQAAGSAALEAFEVTSASIVRAVVSHRRDCLGCRAG